MPRPKLGAVIDITGGIDDIEDACAVLEEEKCDGQGPFECSRRVSSMWYSLLTWVLLHVQVGAHSNR